MALVLNGETLEFAGEAEVRQYLSEVAYPEYGNQIMGWLASGEPSIEIVDGITLVDRWSRA